MVSVVELIIILLPFSVTSYLPKMFFGSMLVLISTGVVIHVESDDDELYIYIYICIHVCIYYFATYISDILYTEDFLWVYVGVDFYR
jgi:uncharacterized membrane protein